MGLIELSYISDFITDYAKGLENLLADLAYLAVPTVAIPELDPKLFPAEPEPSASVRDGDVGGGSPDD